MTMTTRAMVSSSVNWTSSTAARIVVVRSLMSSILIAGGIAATRRGRVALIRSTVSMTLAPGCLKITRNTPRLPLAQAACLASSAPLTAWPTSRIRKRTAIAISDDDVVPVLGLGELVVGVDRVGALRPVDIALGAVDRGDRDLAAHVLQRQALGDEFRRVDLDADGGLLLAADEDLRDARELADLLGELGVDGVADAGQRQCIGGRREQQDRRVGRVDLAVGRRRGQVLRQLAARGVDGALHVVGGAVDAAVEVELDGDRGGAQIARRGHLGDAGDLGELPLERLGHRRGHRLGAAARQIGRDLDGREVHLRQRRDRQQGIGDETDEENAGHQQRGADGITDERCRNPARVHSCRTLFWLGSVARHGRRDEASGLDLELAAGDHLLPGRQALRRRPNGRRWRS